MTLVLKKSETLKNQERIYSIYRFSAPKNKNGKQFLRMLPVSQIENHSLQSASSYCSRLFSVTRVYVLCLQAAPKRLSHQSSPVAHFCSCLFQPFPEGFDHSCQESRYPVMDIFHGPICYCTSAVNRCKLLELTSRSFVHDRFHSEEIQPAD